MSSDFAGKVALVTGGASGIGRAVVELLAARGAAVVIGDRDATGGRRVADEVTSGGGRAMFVEVDIADGTQVRQLVETAGAVFGGLDVAVNNAGFGGPYHRTAEYPEELWHKSIAVMLTGVFLCMKYEIPLLSERGGGVIVNTSSEAGMMGVRGMCGYSAAKHGVLGLTRTAALEYADRGIRVNSVMPGITATGLLEGVAADHPELIARAAQARPIKRVAEPREIAEAVVWLCSDAASYVIGHGLVVDGGYLAQ